MARRTLAISIGFVALVSVGCSHLERWEAVQPWERGVLARDDMAWDPDELEANMRSHVFFSKEASLVGGSAGGGGCGCN